MSDSNQQQPPVAVPPRQGYPPELYAKPVRFFRSPPRPFGRLSPQQLRHEHTLPPDKRSFMEGCLNVLCCRCLVDACF